MDSDETIPPQFTTSSHKAMSLTPVPVRGKRKRNAQSTIDPPAALLDLISKKPKMKRPLSTVLSTRPLRRPTLDSLPAEILESILLYSSNLSLPRASHLLGAKLSGRATLLRLFMWAFHDTWDHWFGVPTSEDLLIGPRPEDLILEVPEGDAAFQSAVLELPWVKIDFILQAQQTWADTYAKDRWYLHCFNSSSETTHEVYTPGIHRHNREGGFGHFNARECFEDDYQWALAWYIQAVPGFPGGSWGTQDVHPYVRLPTDLMTGPWDDEQQRRLFWLIRGGAKSFGNRGLWDVPWEVKLQCLHNAVIDPPVPNILVTNLLLINNTWMDLPGEVAIRESMALKTRLVDGGETITRKEQDTYWIVDSELMRFRP
ncbi:Fc.00g038260.m01.CDS01 [Cosmosporella sp. VM-42]